MTVGSSGLYQVMHALILHSSLFAVSHAMFLNGYASVMKLDHIDNYSLFSFSPHRDFLQFQFHLCSVKEAQKLLGDKQRMRRELLTLETHVSPTTEALHGQDKQPTKRKQRVFISCLIHMQKTRFSHESQGKGNFIPTSAEHSINSTPLGHYIMPTYGRLKMYRLPTKVAVSRLNVEAHMQVVRSKRSGTKGPGEEAPRK